MRPPATKAPIKQCLWLALAVAGHGLAAEAEGYSESDLLADMPVVLTASRIAQSPLDAPAPVTVIDRETILASGFTEIHDIFRLVPGFLVAEWPEGSPIVVNHGLGDAYSRRLLVLLDGRALYDPLRGGVDWQDLPLRLDDIERIEVVRGPNPASYGANAFQGVINIITRVPIGEHNGGMVLRAGQGDLGDAYAYMARGDGRFNWRISASARQATNYRDLNRPLQEYNEAIERQALNGQFIWNPSLDEEYSLRLGLVNGINQIGQTGAASNPVRDVDVRNHFLDLGWKRIDGAGSERTLRYYHYARKQRDQYTVYPTNPLANPPSLGILDNLDVQRDDLEYQQVHAWSERLTGLWGVGLRHDAAESPSALTGLGTVGGWQSQAFGNLDWKPAPAWLLHVGGMVEKHYNTDVLFSPRLALNYQLTPSQSLRFSAGRGYRAPTIFETDAREMVTWSGGVAEVEHYAYRDLKPEKLDFAELGYVGLLQHLGLRLDARVYLNKYGNFIDEQSCILDAESRFPVGDDNYYGVPCGFPIPAGYERPLGYSGKPWIVGPSQLPAGDPRRTDPAYINPRHGHYKAFYFFNAGNIRVHGGDLTLDWSHPDWGRVRLSHAITRISASGVGADTALDPNDVSKDQDVEMSAPRHATSLLWSKRFGNDLRLSLGGYWVGDLKWPNDGDEQPAYRRLDARLGLPLKLLGRDDELSLTLQNFDAEHIEFDEYLVERRAFLSYQVSF